MWQNTSVKSTSAAGRGRAGCYCKTQPHPQENLFVHSFVAGISLKQFPRKGTTATLAASRTMLRLCFILLSLIVVHGASSKRALLQTSKWLCEELPCWCTWITRSRWERTESRCEVALSLRFRLQTAELHRWYCLGLWFTFSTVSTFWIAEPSNPAVSFTTCTTRGPCST